MSTPVSPIRLEARRFSTRFLGRAGTWIWLLLTLGPGVASWVWATGALRGFAGDERTWFLWSGNVVLGLFVLTLFFVFRKWAVKLPAFRNRGRTSPAMADASWVEIQDLNKRIAKGAYSSDGEILKTAEEILARFHAERIERPEIHTMKVGGKDVKFVRLRKREAFGRLEPWLEMHMGVGVAACVGVWFHADGVLRHPLGWILFVGSMIVLVTGVLGALLYRSLPEKLARDTLEIPYEEAGVAREAYTASLDGWTGSLEEGLRTEIRSILSTAPDYDALRKRCDDVLGRVATKSPDQAEVVRDLVVMAGTRDYLLWTTAASRAVDFQLKLWRWIHVPVSVFLFFVIALHVWVVLWY